MANTLDAVYRVITNPITEVKEYYNSKNRAHLLSPDY